MSGILIKLGISQKKRLEKWVSKCERELFVSMTRLIPYVYLMQQSKELRGKNRYGKNLKIMILLIMVLITLLPVWLVLGEF